MFTPEKGGIVIAERYEELAKSFEEELKPLRSILFLREDFKVEDAKEVIAEAYRSEETQKTLILGAKSFTVPAQNALLKILEEPPKNIVFLLLAPNKSTFLPTVRSRLRLIHDHQPKVYEALNLTLGSLDLQGMFNFVKDHSSLKKHDAKDLIEALLYHAVHIENLSLTSAQLESFDKAFRLIELNSRFQTVLVMILMNFLKEVKRAR